MSAILTGYDEMTPRGLRDIGGKTRRRARNAPTPGQFQLTAILEAAGQSEEAHEQLCAVLKYRKLAFAAEWRCRDAIPPGSLLESVCDAFGRGSNIPLEIPLALTLHLVSGVLLQRGVTIKTSAGELYPKLWSIVLANSSSGKTFTFHQLLNGLNLPNPEVPGMAGAVTGAALFSVIAQCPKGLLVRDEFGQLVGRIERDLHLSDFKDLLLRLYDGHALTWTTKKDGAQTIDSPQISILGLTQHDTWHEKVSAESMLDGFAARFSLMIARPDPARNWKDFPVWRIDATAWPSDWARCAAAIQPRYESTEAAEDHFCASFRALAADTELPEPFFRRILHSCHRLACIYHVIQANPSPQLDAADYGWALRLLRHHLADAVSVFGEQNCSEIERLVRGAEALRERYRARGETFNERTLYKNFRALTPLTASVILRLLHETEHHS